MSCVNKTLLPYIGKIDLVLAGPGLESWERKPHTRPYRVALYHEGDIFSHGTNGRLRLCIDAPRVFERDEVRLA